MGWTYVLPPGNSLFPGTSTFPGASTFTGASTYPELLLEWAPTTQPTDSVQAWEDITERLRDWSWGYGRNDELAVFEAGTGSLLLDNRDRELDPSFDAGQWFGDIKPKRMFRLRAQFGSEYPVFVAYSRGFPQNYPATGFDNVVKVDVVDAFAILQGVDLVVGFTRPTELTGARIAAVCDAVGIPTNLRDIDPGTVTVAALDIEAPGTSGLGHAKQVALDSEMGQLFVAKDGRLTFHDYERRLNGTGAHTFSDTTGAPLAYTGLDPAFDETYLWNYIRVTGAAGDETAEVSEDPASQDDYFLLTKTVSTQLVSGSDIKQVADRYAFRYTQPELRAPSLQLAGAGNPTVRWPVILNLEVSDRITVQRFADDADPMILEQTVEGIRHACKPGGPWTTTVITSPADVTSPTGENTYLELNHATFSELDNIYILS